MKVRFGLRSNYGLDDSRGTKIAHHKNSSVVRHANYLLGGGSQNTQKEGTICIQRVIIYTLIVSMHIAIYM